MIYTVYALDALLMLSSMTVVSLDVDICRKTCPVTIESNRDLSLCCILKYSSVFLPLNVKTQIYSLQNEVRLIFCPHGHHAFHA